MLNHSAIFETPIFSSKLAQTHVESVSHTVDFTQKLQLLDHEVQQTVEFTQTLNKAVGKKQSHIVEFSQTVRGVVLSHHVRQTVDFTQDGEGINDLLQQNPKQTVEFTQDVSITVVKLVSQTVDFTQQVSRAGSVFNRSVSHTVDFASGAAGILPGSCDTDFDPGIGTRANTTLAHPYAAPTLTINVRNPSFGNSKITDNQAIVDRYRKGDLRSFRDSNWPTIEILEFNLENLTDAEVTNLENFLETSCGEEIKLTDWENRNWKGLIVNEDLTFINEGRPPCKKSLLLRFMGSVV